MRDSVRAARLILALTFRADPVRAAWLTVRAPINMCTMLGTAYGLRQLTNAAVARHPAGVLQAAAFLVAVALLAMLAGAGSLSARATVIEKTSLAIDRLLMGYALAAPGLEHHERPEHLDRLELLRLRRGELGEVVDDLSHNLGMLLLTGGSVLLLTRVSPVLLLLPLAGVPSLLASTRAERMRQRAQEEAAAGLRAARHVFELGTAPAAGAEIRLYGLAGVLGDRHRRLWARADRVQNRAAWRAAALAAGGWVVFSLAYVAAIGYVGWLAAHGRTSPGDVVMTLTLAASVNELVQWLVFLAGWLVGQLRTAGRIVWLADYADSRRFAHPDPAPAPTVLRTGITFEHVSFGYPGGDEVLHDLCLTLPAGATVALIGENGAGKSTFVKLLARFYEPTAGRILVDNIDLRRIDYTAWRARLAAGFQDFARFELTAAANVGVGDLPRMHHDPAVRVALRRAGAGDVVDRLPLGMRTPLGGSADGGTELSGGQWQKLALGRAMMRDVPLLLVLDEPTASLDAATEQALFMRYARRARRAATAAGAVTLLVSHRLSTVRMADLILVLDAGRLAEYGSHAELMARRGRYAELYDLQADAYR